MITRQDIEKHESDWLAPYAVHARRSKGRKCKEQEHAYRSCFQRDKDRIIFCAAFRRLQYKTQVFSNIEGDYYRTRLTHTLEVSQIARSLARSLRLNEDLCEAIALAHDLGHGPFGHIGEEILNECMREYGGFEHNQQSLRVVEVLEDIYVKGRGLNLTYETCEGLKKHTYRKTTDTIPVSYTTLEAQVVDIADEIAYVSHDLDDGLRAKLFFEEDIKGISLIEQISDSIDKNHPYINRFQFDHLLIRYLINEQVTNLIAESERRIKQYDIVTLSDVCDRKEKIIDFSEDFKRAVQKLRDFLFKNFYKNKQVIKIIDEAQHCLQTLFQYFVIHPEEMPPHYFNKVRSQEDGTHRIVCDYIAGMTDRFAIDEYVRVINSK